MLSSGSCKGLCLTVSEIEIPSSTVSLLKHYAYIATVIINSKLLKRHSKAKRRAPAYSRALRQIRGVFQKIDVLPHFTEDMLRLDSLI